MAGQTAASTVREIVDSDPFLQQCLAKRLANFSEVARRIKPLVEARLGRRVSTESVKMALIRYAERLSRSQGLPVAKVMSVLARSVVELRMGVGLATFRLHVLPSILRAVVNLVPKARFFSLMQTPISVTVIADDETVGELVSAVGGEGLVDLRRGQAAIVIVSPREIIETPGVMAYVASLLAQHGVNILQVESCYTETVLIVGREDAEKALHALTAAIEMAKLLTEGLGEE